MWRSTQGPEAGENLIVMVKPFRGTAMQAADVPSYKRQFPGAQMQLQTTTVCGGHPALYSFMQADKNGRHLIQEAIVYVWAPYAYIAMYTRFGQQPALQAARSSLVRFCPPGSPGRSTTSW